MLDITAQLKSITGNTGSLCLDVGLIMNLKTILSMFDNVNLLSVVKIESGSYLITVKADNFVLKFVELEDY
tara:strand:+ start:1412 stop:1624 length:213 start_codon:yes stop_codon:yes gene_type:complete